MPCQFTHVPICTAPEKIVKYKFFENSNPIGLTFYL